mmetsp:Transcript_19143/g.73565  ORF Transcript_19143/g.73565 Transcript_19143/m.73565 type:complete len:419 (-) Transcript_19143:1344-2600(-)
MAQGEQADSVLADGHGREPGRESHRRLVVLQQALQPRGLQQQCWLARQRHCDDGLCAAKVGQRPRELAPPPLPVPVLALQLVVQLLLGALGHVGDAPAQHRLLVALAFRHGREGVQGQGPRDGSLQVGRGAAEDVLQNGAQARQHAVAHLHAEAAELSQAIRRRLQRLREQDVPALQLSCNKVDRRGEGRQGVELDGGGVAEAARHACHLHARAASAHSLDGKVDGGRSLARHAHDESHAFGAANDAAAEVRRGGDSDHVAEGTAGDVQGQVLGREVLHHRRERACVAVVEETGGRQPQGQRQLRDNCRLSCTEAEAVARGRHCEDAVAREGVGNLHWDQGVALRIHADALREVGQRVEVAAQSNLLRLLAVGLLSAELQVVLLLLLCLPALPLPCAGSATASRGLLAEHAPAGSCGS